MTRSRILSIALPPAETSTAHLTSPVLATARTTEDVCDVIKTLAALMEKQRYPAPDLFGARLALEETMVNTIKHGHGYDPSLTVRVRLWVTAEEVLIDVEDEGPGFDPADVADPCEPE